MMTGKRRILVTGASSYVGAGIYEFLAENHDVFGTFYSNKLFDGLVKMDVTNRANVGKVITNVKPQVIVHAAANPSAGWCKAHPKEAVAINELGTKNVVDAANSVGAKVIYISSFAAVAPNTLYGKTKLKGEEYVKGANAGWVILRPSLIVGYSPNTTNDRPFNRILRNLLEKTPAEYDNSWKFQATWLRQLCEVIEQIILREITGKIIPLSVPELTTRFNLANDILKEFGISVKAIDKKDDSPVFQQPLGKLNELGLPQYRYAEMIAGIVEEIRANLLGK